MKRIASVLRVFIEVMLLVFNLTSISAQQAEPVKLPNGWNLTPAGRQFPLGDLPLNMAVSPDNHWLAVTNNGYGRQCIQLFDVTQQKQTADITIKKSWYGLCFSPDNRNLYASAGNDNQVKIYTVSIKGEMNLTDSIVMGKGWDNQRISPSGLAICPRNGNLYVVTRWDNSLYIYELPSKRLLRKEPVGGEAYQVLFNKDGSRAYVSSWGSDEVAVWDVNNNRWLSRIQVGSHPNEMCIDYRHDRLFVANANDNSVSVIDLRDNHVEETLNAALFVGSLEGSTTNGLCLFNRGKDLAIANADNNCLTVFDVSKPGQSKVKGFIPTGWYPTNVKSTGKTLWVTNGKGLRSMANPNGPVPVDRREKFGHHQGDSNHTDVQYIGGLFLGALSAINVPNEKTLARYSRQVYENTPYRKSEEYESEGQKGNPIPCVSATRAP